MGFYICPLRGHKQQKCIYSSLREVIDICPLRGPKARCSGVKQDVKFAEGDTIKKPILNKKQTLKTNTEYARLAMYVRHA
jgi:Ni,Fe-hydrogenase III large subunit